MEQRTRRHARRPGRPGRSEHSDGTSRYRIGDEGAAIDAAAGQRREQIAGRHAAAVGGDAGNFQATRIRQEAEWHGREPARESRS